ncbi:MAG: ATP-binding protein, partial [Ferruginibacter sp.]
METLIGREAERKLLEKVFDSGNPELVAIYGRRRVGKTFLIRTAYSGRIIFEFSGIHSGNMDTQLQNFTNSMKA